MEIELASHIQSLMNEYDELKSLRHGVYKEMLPPHIVTQKVAEYDREIAKIEKEIDELIIPTIDPAKKQNTEQMGVSEIEEIISRAIFTYGKEAQTQMLFEEMSELQNALCKLARGRDTSDHVCEEIADVMIMCFQMAHIYGLTKVENWANKKILRLRERLTGQQNERDDKADQILFKG